jgi:hypothetical protein
MELELEQIQTSRVVSLTIGSFPMKLDWPRLNHVGLEIEFEIEPYKSELELQLNSMIDPGNKTMRLLGIYQ